MELKRQVLTSEILHPAHDFEPRQGQVEVRWDPLTGHSSRLVTSGGPLLPRSDFDLAALAAETQPACFFCGPRVEEVTPKLPPAIHPEGRIKRNQALLFPNLMTYSQYSSVSIYSPDLHFLPLERMTGRLIADNLGVQVEFIQAVMRFDEKASWASINANHMLPSGSSLFHPHVQSSVDPVPSTMQRLLCDVEAERFSEYVATEKRLGERYLGSTGSAEWLVSFAPQGFNEVRALLPGIASPAQLANEHVEELGEGIARVLNLYGELGFQSFNLALYGAPPTSAGYMLNLRLVCRSNLQPLYRSDVTYFERLHWQAMVDGSPEELARRGRERFTA
jgi:UDPglucose--hexose-1-phosphate uridylyltransferase